MQADESKSPRRAVCPGGCVLVIISDQPAPTLAGVRVGAMKERRRRSGWGGVRECSGGIFQLYKA